MIVEDEPSFQELVQLVLSLDPKFEIIRTVESGEEAMEGVDSLDLDLVLLDFRLPGIDGIETAKRLKERHPDLKIALVTAHSEEVLGRLAKEADILAVIPKASFSLERVDRLLSANS